MPLFKRENQELQLIKQSKFINEKELQTLIEKNLETVFNCRLIATEFTTGPIHGGRIDSLALSEENNPVIIEYKVVESSQLVNQSLYYLSWIKDHKGDFEIVVQKILQNKKIEIDWSSIRVICIAPEYKKYDIHAVQMMGANIELWQYKYYQNGVISLEEIYRKSTLFTESDDNQNLKNPIMVEAGKKAAISRATGSYTIDKHIQKIEIQKKGFVQEIRDFILSIDESIEEVPKKFYIAYKVSQNFVCMEIHKNKFLLYLKISMKDINSIPPNGRDVTNIGHYGTGNFELSLKTSEDIENAKEYIQIAFNNIGGN